MLTVTALCVIAAALAAPAACASFTFTRAASSCWRHNDSVSASATHRNITGISSLRTCAVECAATNSCAVFQFASDARICIIGSECDFQLLWVTDAGHLCDTHRILPPRSCVASPPAADLTPSSDTGQTGSVHTFAPNPAGACYEIVAWGAAGGNADSGLGGKGAKVSGFFVLTSALLTVVVGKKGQDRSGSSGAGGGGGSFVYKDSSNLLLAAGGGGGGAKSSAGVDAVNGETAAVARGAGVSGASPGQGGQKGGGSSGGGGAGWQANGQPSSKEDTIGQGGKKSSNSWQGGDGSNNGGGDGGGGGGGGGGSAGDDDGGGGGGGGYSGGGAAPGKGGGGGGSYVAAGAKGVAKVGGESAGAGRVTIVHVGDSGHASCATARK